MEAHTARQTQLTGAVATAQRDNMFYRALSYVLPTTIMRLPYSILEAIVWTGLTYWVIDLAPTASRCAACVRLGC